MYHDVKARIKHNGSFSATFSCEIGLKQGENLSPYLFSVFLNDLDEFFRSKIDLSLPYLSETLQNEVGLYINLFALLYADDTILIGESENDLQLKLDYFSEYCLKWRLNVNVEKTKIVIFGRKPRRSCLFKYREQCIEIVDEFKYLGVIFTRIITLKRILRISTQKV